MFVLLVRTKCLWSLDSRRFASRLAEGFEIDVADGLLKRFCAISLVSPAVKRSLDKFRMEQRQSL